MAQIDKVQVKSTTYDIAQSSNATFAGTSNDSSSPASWTSVDVLRSGETNGSIFTKISKMFSNIRWLYNQLGTTDYSAAGSTVSGALSALQSGKAAKSHSHTTADLPISSQQADSDALIPTSKLVNSMNNTLTSLNDAIIKETTNFIIDIYDGENYICSADSVYIKSHVIRHIRFTVFMDHDHTFLNTPTFHFSIKSICDEIFSRCNYLPIVLRHDGSHLEVATLQLFADGTGMLRSKDGNPRPQFSNASRIAFLLTYIV